MSHAMDEVCEYGYNHRIGCPECKTDTGHSPHGFTDVECPTPARCEARFMAAINSRETNAEACRQEEASTKDRGDGYER